MPAPKIADFIRFAASLPQTNEPVAETEPPSQKTNDADSLWSKSEANARGKGWSDPVQLPPFIHNRPLFTSKSDNPAKLLESADEVADLAMQHIAMRSTKRGGSEQSVRKICYWQLGRTAHLGYSASIDCMREHRNANVLLACAKSICEVSHTDAEDELTEDELVERNFDIWGPDLPEAEQFHVRSILDGFLFVRVHQTSRSLGPGWEFYFWLMAECFITQAKLKRGLFNHDEGFLRILDAGQHVMQHTGISAQERMQELVAATAEQYVRGILARLPEGRTSRFRAVVDEYAPGMFLTQLVERAKVLINRQIPMFRSSPAALLAEARGKAHDVFELLIQKYVNVRTRQNGFQVPSNRSADRSQLDATRSMRSTAANSMSSGGSVVQSHNPEPLRSVHKDAERLASARVLSTILAKNPGYRKGKNLPNLTKVRVKVQAADPAAYVWTHVHELALTLSYAIKIRTAVLMSSCLARAAATTAALAARDVCWVRVEVDGKIKSIPLMQYARERRTVIRVQIGRANADRAVKVVAAAAAYVASSAAKIAAGVSERVCLTATSKVEHVLIALANSIDPPCPSEARTDKIAYACAHLHIQRHNIKLFELRRPPAERPSSGSSDVSSGSFCRDGQLLLNSDQSKWRSVQMEKRGVSVRFMADFMRACSIPLPPNVAIFDGDGASPSPSPLLHVPIGATDAAEEEAPACFVDEGRAVEVQADTEGEVDMGVVDSILDEVMVEVVGGAEQDTSTLEEDDGAAVERGLRGLELLWLIQQLTYPTGFSLAELAAAGGSTDADEVPYTGHANAFVTHTWTLQDSQRSFASTDYSALLYFVHQRGPSAKTLYCFTDAFGLNQNLLQRDETEGNEGALVKGQGGKGYVGAGGQELAALDAVIKSCGQTLLLIDRWHNPSVLRRLWCLFELERSVKHGVPIRLALSMHEVEDLRLALGNVHPDGIAPRTALDALSRIPNNIGVTGAGSSSTPSNARARGATSSASGGCICTRREDMVRLCRRIEMEVVGGYEGLRQRVQLALTHSLVGLVQEQTKPTLNMLGLLGVVEQARKFGLPTSSEAGHAKQRGLAAKKAAKEAARAQNEAEMAVARELEEWRERTVEKTMTVNGREYCFTVPERHPASTAGPKLVIVVGGMGQGKSMATMSKGAGVLDGLHTHRIELGMDAFKAACTPFLAALKATKEDDAIESEEVREEKVNELKKEYRMLIEEDEGKIVKLLMEWKADIVCEFTNESNLFDMAMGNGKSVFPSLKAMGDCGYKLRLVSVQCMDTPENIVVGINSRKDLGQMGLGMQKWSVTKGCLVRGAFFLDSLKCVYRRAQEEGSKGLVEKAMVMTRLSWNTTEWSSTIVDSESLLASKFVAEVDRDGDIISSEEWQEANTALEKLFDAMMSEEEESQPQFTSDLLNEVRSYYARDEVIKLLAKEAAAQEYITEEREVPTEEQLQAAKEAAAAQVEEKAVEDEESLKVDEAAMEKMVEKGGDALQKMLTMMLALQVLYCTRIRELNTAKSTLLTLTHLL
jgi:hypothetical protein